MLTQSSNGAYWAAYWAAYWMNCRQRESSQRCGWTSWTHVDRSGLQFKLNSRDLQTNFRKLNVTRPVYPRSYGSYYLPALLESRPSHNSKKKKKRRISMTNISGHVHAQMII